VSFKKVTPATLAAYDQCLAETQSNLNDLVKIWKSTHLDTPEHYALAGFARSLHQNIEAEHLAEILTLAIRRIAGERG
jgi:hypothetical protein